MSTNTTKKMQVFGLKGKSAYEYAQEGGYTGTEEEFRAKLAKEYYTYDELHDKPFEEYDRPKQLYYGEVSNYDGKPTVQDDINLDMQETLDVVIYDHDKNVLYENSCALINRSLYNAYDAYIYGNCSLLKNNSITSFLASDINTDMPFVYINTDVSSSSLSHYYLCIDESLLSAKDKYGVYYIKFSNPNQTEHVIVTIDEKFIPDSIARTKDVLKKDNTEEYTPTEDYHPATKQYVDESIKAIPSDAFVVNITDDDDNGYTADKTFAEIVEARENGDYIVAYYQTAQLQLSYVLSSELEFTYMRTDGYGWLIAFVMQMDNNLYCLNKELLETSDVDLTTNNKDIIGAINELNSTKLSLPTDSEGNVVTGTAGQVLVSDGNGGFTWTTISTETAEDGNEVTY